MLFSFILIQVVVYAISVYLARHMANLHPASNAIDKILGVLVGGFQGVLLSSIILFNLNYLGFPSPDIQARSRLYPGVIGVAPAFFDKLISFFPGTRSIYDEYRKLSE